MNFEQAFFDELEKIAYEVSGADITYDRKHVEFYRAYNKGKFPKPTDKKNLWFSEYLPKGAKLTRTVEDDSETVSAKVPLKHIEKNYPDMYAELLKEREYQDKILAKIQKGVTF